MKKFRTPATSRSKKDRFDSAKPTEGSTPCQPSESDSGSDQNTLSVGEDDNRLDFDDTKPRKKKAVFGGLKIPKAFKAGKTKSKKSDALDAVDDEGLTRQQARLEELERQVTELGNERDNLQSILESKDLTINQLKAEVDSLEVKINIMSPGSSSPKLANKMDEVTEKFKVLKITLDTEREHRLKLEKERDGALKSIRDLQDEAATLRAQLSKTVYELAETKLQLTEATSQLEGFKSHKPGDSPSALQDTIEDLRRELDSTRDSEQSLKRKNDFLEEQLLAKPQSIGQSADRGQSNFGSMSSELTKTLQDLDLERIEHQALQSRLGIDSNLAAAKLDTINKDLLAAKKDVALAKEREIEARALAEHYGIRLLDAERNANEAIERAHSSDIKAIQAAESAQKANDEFRDYKRRAEDTVNQAKEEIFAKDESLKAKTDELEAKTDELKTKTDELKAKTDELKAKTDELEAKTDELEAKTAELIETRENLIIARQAIAKSEDEARATTKLEDLNTISAQDQDLLSKEDELPKVLEDQLCAGRNALATAAQSVERERSLKLKSATAGRARHINQEITTNDQRSSINVHSKELDEPDSCQYDSAQSAQDSDSPKMSNGVRQSPPTPSPGLTMLWHNVELDLVSLQDLEDCKCEIQTLNARLEETTTILCSAQSDNTEMSMKLKSLESELNDCRKDALAWRNQCETTAVELIQAQSSFTLVNEENAAQISRQSAEISERRAEGAAKFERVRQLELELDAAHRQQNEKLEAVSSNSSALEIELADMKSNFAAAMVENERLESELKEVQKVLNILHRELLGENQDSGNFPVDDDLTERTALVGDMLEAARETTTTAETRLEGDDLGKFLITRLRQTRGDAESLRREIFDLRAEVRMLNEIVAEEKTLAATEIRNLKETNDTSALEYRKSVDDLSIWKERGKKLELSINLMESEVESLKNELELKDRVYLTKMDAMEDELTRKVMETINMEVLECVVKLLEKQFDHHQDDNSGNQRWKDQIEVLDAAIQNQKAKYMQSICLYDQQIVSRQKLNDDLQSDLREELKNKSQEIGEMQRKLRYSEEDLAGIIAHKYSLESTNQSLNNELNKLRQDVEVQKRLYEDAITDSSFKEQQIEALNQRMAVEDHEEAIHDLKTVTKKLRSAEIALNRSSANLRERELAIETLLDEKVVKEKQVETIRAENDALKLETRNLTREHEDKVSKLSIAKSAIEREVDDLRKQLIRSHEDMAAMDNTLRELKSQKTGLEADVEDLRNNLTRLKRTLDQAESDLKEQSTVSTRQSKELNDLLQELRSEKRSLTNCMNDQSIEIAKLNNDVALSKIRIEAAEESNQELQKQLRVHLDKEMAKAADISSKETTMQRQIHELTTKKNELASQLQNNTAREDRLKAEAEKLRAESSDLKESHALQKADIVKLQARIRNLSETNIQLDKAVENLSRSANEDSLKRKELSASEISSLRTKIAAAETRNHELLRDIEEIKRKWEHDKSLMKRDMDNNKERGVEASKKGPVKLGSKKPPTDTSTDRKTSVLEVEEVYSGIIVSVTAANNVIPNKIQTSTGVLEIVMVLKSRLVECLFEGHSIGGTPCLKVAAGGVFRDVLRDISGQRGFVNADKRPEVLRVLSRVRKLWQLGEDLRLALVQSDPKLAKAFQDSVTTHHDWETTLTSLRGCAEVIEERNRELERLASGYQIAVEEARTIAKLDREKAKLQHCEQKRIVSDQEREKVLSENAELHGTIQTLINDHQRLSQPPNYITNVAPASPVVHRRILLPAPSPLNRQLQNQAGPFFQQQ